MDEAAKTESKDSLFDFYDEDNVEGAKNVSKETSVEKKISDVISEVVNLHLDGKTNEIIEAGKTQANSSLDVLENNDEPFSSSVQEILIFRPKSVEIHSKSQENIATDLDNKSVTEQVFENKEDNEKSLSYENVAKIYKTHSGSIEGNSCDTTKDKSSQNELHIVIPIEDGEISDYGDETWRSDYTEADDKSLPRSEISIVGDLSSSSKSRIRDLGDEKSSTSLENGINSRSVSVGSTTATRRDAALSGGSAEENSATASPISGRVSDGNASTATRRSNDIEICSRFSTSESRNSTLCSEKSKSNFSDCSSPAKTSCSSKTPSNRSTYEEEAMTSNKCSLPVTPKPAVSDVESSFHEKKTSLVPYVRTKEETLDPIVDVRMENRLTRAEDDLKHEFKKEVKNKAPPLPPRILNQKDVDVINEIRKKKNNRARNRSAEGNKQLKTNFAAKWKVYSGDNNNSKKNRDKIGHQREKVGYVNCKRDDISSNSSFISSLPSVLTPLEQQSNNDSSNEKILHVDYLKVHKSSDEHGNESRKNQVKQKRNKRGQRVKDAFVSQSPYCKSELSSRTELSRLSLPSINTSKTVHLIRSDSTPMRKRVNKRSKTFSNSDSGTLTNSDSLDSASQRCFPSESRETFEAPINRFPRQRRPLIPIPLKAEALYRDGQLEVSVMDNQYPESENLNVKITLVHKYIPSKTKVHPLNHVYARGPKPRPMFEGATDRDIIKHRAMYPPMNTYTDEEASKRHRQYYGQF